MSWWFCGNGPFAARCLRALHDRGQDPDLVLVGGPTPQGRGRKLVPQPVQEAAQELGLPVTVIGLLGQETDLLNRARDVDLMLVLDFGQKVNHAWLEAPRHGVVNLHPSLLPRWRGAAPLQRALLAGDAQVGVTLFFLEERMDAGPIAAHWARPVRGDETLEELYDEMALRGAELFGGLVTAPEGARGRACPQDERQATYAAKVDKAEGFLDPGLPAAQLDRVVRALCPKPGAWFLRAHDRVGVQSARVGQSKAALRPGEVIFEGGRVFYGVSDGWLELLEVVPPGKKRMKAADWARGWR